MLKKLFIVITIAALVPQQGFSQFSEPSTDAPLALGEVYTLKPAVDIPVTAVGTAWSLYAFTKIYSKDPIPLDVVKGLTKDDVNGFDRWAAGMTDEKISKISDYPFYAAMPLPLLLLLDKEIRHDAPKVGFLYLESMAITGLLYTGSTYFTNRYRPKTYDVSVPAEDRTNGGNKNSFFAGHVALAGTSTFFIAKVYGDYHPNSSLKYWLYGGAIATTGAMAYFRHKAGHHFPSDIIIGTAVGTLSGILVPHLHKTKNRKEQAWNISPYMDQNVTGLTFNYNIR